MWHDCYETMSSLAGLAKPFRSTTRHSRAELWYVAPDGALVRWLFHRRTNGFASVWLKPSPFKASLCGARKRPYADLSETGEVVP